MLRKAKPSDLEAIVSLGLEALENDPYENLVISPRKVREIASQIISSPQDFIMVCDIDGDITGVVAATVGDMLFYERKQASVLMFYCNTPGEGIKLIREFLRWARSRPAIKLVEFTLERNMDPRIGVMLKRLGLDTALPIYVQVL